MGTDNNASFIMAQRLKQLREGKCLSHDKLSKALFDQYCVKISSDSLINYEVAEANHTKAYKNQGMRIEYLRCLADFYGVSTDYLLGISDVKSPNQDIVTAVKMTGLTQESIQSLSFFHQLGDREMANVLDILINDSKYHNSDENRSYRSIINLLNFFFSYSSGSNRKQVFINGHIVDRNDTDGLISSNAIALDDTIIENAVLAEIQHALISLKKSL